MRRREFLRSTLAVISFPDNGFSGSADLSSYQKLGFNSYCLRAFRWRDRQVLDYAAGLKLDAVFLQDSTDPEAGNLAHWSEVGRYARQLGLHIETGVGAVLPKSEGGFEDSRQQLLTGIARARAVGSPLVRCLHASDRQHLPPGSMDQHRETMVKLLRSVRSQVMDAGLKIAIENHKDLQAFEMREVIESAGPEFVGSYLDTGNPVFVAENPATTVEVLGPYALCLHLRDSVVYEHPRGAMVQWVPLGEGSIDFGAIVDRVRELKPQIYVYNKPITGRPPQLIPYLEDEFWRSYARSQAVDIVKFVELAHRGRPFEGSMVTEDLPGRKSMREAYSDALRLQQRENMEQGIEYAKKELDLGQKWRA